MNDPLARPDEDERHGEGPEGPDEFEEPFLGDHPAGPEEDEEARPEAEAPHGAGGPAHGAGAGGTDGPEAARGIPPTELEPPAGGPDADTRGDTSRLPPPLREEFRLRELLRRPERPGEAAVFRVRDEAGTDHVLKWYHRGYAPDPRVRDLLGVGRPPHVVPVTATGTAGGHPYEIMPSCGDTDLAQYLRGRTGPAAPDFVRTLVAQLHAALAALHRLGIVHRDISPANIVLGSLDPAAPELTLVDLSLAAHAPEPRTAEHGDWAGTARYLSPEAVISRQLIHPAADWWSLGMIVAELAGGRHPLKHSLAGYVHVELVSRPPDLSLVGEARLLLLCQGLLIRDPDHRWGAEEVGRWLAGESPPLTAGDWRSPSGAAPDGSTNGNGNAGGAAGIEPFPFMGRPYTEPFELGVEFDRHWREMAGTLARGRTRRVFTRWLSQFAESPRYDLAAREELTALLALLARAPGPETLLRLVSWLAPSLDPGYRGEPLGPDGHLHDLALRASDRGEDDARARSVVADLAAHPGILPLLDARPGGEGLADVQAAWSGLRRRWQPTVDALRAEFPALRQPLRESPQLTDEDGWLAAELLRTAAAPERVRALLDERATRLLRRLPAPVPWYAWLLRDRRDPLPLLLAHRLSTLAEEEARRTARGLADARARQRHDAEFRQLAAWMRVQEMPAALGWAIAGATAVTFPWIFVIGIADVAGLAAQETVVTAWACAVPAATVVFVLELWAAHRIGLPAYHPRHSLAGQALRTAGRAFRPVLRHRVLGTLGVAAAVALLFTTVLVAAWAWSAGTVAAMAWWSWRRHRAWSRALRPGPGLPATAGGTAGDGGGAPDRPGSRAAAVPGRTSGERPGNRPGDASGEAS